MASEKGTERRKRAMELERQMFEENGDHDSKQLAAIWDEGNTREDVREAGNDWQVRGQAAREMKKAKRDAKGALDEARDLRVGMAEAPVVVKRAQNDAKAALIDESRRTKFHEKAQEEADKKGRVLCLCAPSTRHAPPIVVSKYHEITRFPHADAPENALDMFDASKQSAAGALSPEEPQDPAEPKTPGDSQGGQGGQAGEGMKNIGFRNDSRYKGSSIKLTEGPTLEIKDHDHQDSKKTAPTGAPPG